MSTSEAEVVVSSNLLAIDWNEMQEIFEDELELKPFPDIIEYATAEKYLNLKLFPEQKLILRVVYNLELDELDNLILDEWILAGYVPFDIRERLADSRNADGFKEIVLCLGRRGSKGFLVSIINSYDLLRLLKRYDPAGYYNLPEGERIYFPNCASSEKQALDVLFPAIRNRILSCEEFQPYIHSIQATELRFATKADQARTKELQAQGVKVDDQYSIILCPTNARAGGLRGKACLDVVFDEQAFYQNQEGKDNAAIVYEAMQPSTKTFYGDGRTISMSTPKYEDGFFYEQLQQAAKSPVMIFFHMPSWEMYKRGPLVGLRPRMTLEELASEFEKNPDSAWREYGAKFSNVLERYIKEQEIIDAVFDMHMAQRDMGIQHIDYHIHADPGRTRASFAVVLGHGEGDVVIYDHMHIWRVALDKEDYEANHEPYETVYPPLTKIIYEHVEDYIIELLRCFNVEELTFDQWDSTRSIQTIEKWVLQNQITRKTVVRVKDFGVKQWRWYENWVTALHQRKVRTFFFSRAKKEMEGLQDKKGKIIPANSGLVQTQDICDCMVALHDRITDQSGTKGGIPGKADQINLPAGMAGRMTY